MGFTSWAMLPVANMGTERVVLLIQRVIIRISVKEYYLYVRGKLIFAALKRGALVDAVTLFKRPGDLKYSLRRISFYRSISGSCGAFSKYKGALI